MAVYQLEMASFTCSCSSALRPLLEEEELSSDEPPLLPSAGTLPVWPVAWAAAEEEVEELATTVWRVVGAAEVVAAGVETAAAAEVELATGVELETSWTATDDEVEAGAAEEAAAAEEEPEEEEEAEPEPTAVVMSPLST